MQQGPGRPPARPACSVSLGPSFPRLIDLDRLTAGRALDIKVHTDASQPSTAEAGASKSPSAPAAGSSLSNDIYQQDGDFIKDIEVNDLRNRYTLTKGSTQKMVNTHLIPLILLGTACFPLLHLKTNSIGFVANKR